jgi:D-alanine-D-alanine ligase
MTVALLFNPRPSTTPDDLPDDAFEEYDRPEVAAAIARALVGLGLDVTTVAADRDLARRLEDGCYDFVFNIAEGTGRRCRAAVPAAICELLRIPYTGSDPLTLAATLDKWLARRIVSPDVPVAPAVLIDTPADEPALAVVPYPAIVKPNDEGSSKGIRADALVDDARAALARVQSLRAVYGCPVLVEAFLPGVEVTVAVVGNGGGARVLGMMEIEPVDAAVPFVYSVDIKRDWRRRVRYHVPPRLAATTLIDLEHCALTAYRLLGCRDIARLDFRLDAQGTPRFLECNPLPGLDPDNSDIVMLAAPSRSYSALVQHIFLTAAERTGVPLPASTPGRSS